MWQKLKEHQVFQVAAVYAVISWVLIQIVVAVEAPLQLPPWIDTFVIVLLAIGFPVALIFAYAFDTSPGSDASSGPPETKAIGLSNSQMIVVVGLAGLLFSGTIAYLALPSETPSGHASAEIAKFRAEQPTGQIPPSSNKGAIAVLPFVNMSDDPEQEYFSDGITEDILTGLLSYQSIPVIARTSSFKYKGVSKDMREIAQDLNASYILEGSVRRLGEEVRITAQLIDFEGNHIWANAFDAPWSDVLSIQDEITAQIVTAIEPEIILSEVDRARHTRPSNMSAWDYYLKARANTSTGLGYYNLNGSRVRKEDNEQARIWAQKAVELDPRFAAGFALLMHIDGVYTGGLAMEVDDVFRAAAFDRALNMAAKARAMNPFEASVCSCQAILLHMKGENELARKIQEDALRENPSSAILHAAYAIILNALGEQEQALEEIHYAKRMSPQDFDMTIYLFMEARIYEAMGKFEKALETTKQALLLSPINANAHTVGILTLFALGRMEDAKKAAEALYAEVPHFTPKGLWPGAFQDSVVASAPAHMKETLTGVSISEGMTLVLRELGFQPDI